VAARAYWKGYLKLSLVSCPIALFPATSEREKISFHQLNKETGNRIRYRKIDAETGDEVSQDNIIKGYELGKGEYIELDPEELEAVAIESRHTLEIEEFVPKKDISTNSTFVIPIISCQTVKLVSRPLPSSATRSVKRTWWRWAKSYSPLANTS
jgi:Ku protein